MYMEQWETACIDVTAPTLLTSSTYVGGDR
jgi:hypothetical protein